MFFDELSATPRRIVADMDGAIEQAVQTSFPRPGDRPSRLSLERPARATDA
jgi:hypothetical protein